MADLKATIADALAVFDQAARTVEETNAQQVQIQRASVDQARTVRVEAPAPHGWAIAVAGGVSKALERLAAVRLERRLVGDLWATLEATNAGGASALVGLRWGFGR